MFIINRPFRQTSPESDSNVLRFDDVITFWDVIGLMGSGVPHCFEWRACASDLAPSGSASESDRHNGLIFCLTANDYTVLKWIFMACNSAIGGVAVQR